MREYRNLVLSALSGFFLWTAFAPFEFWPGSFLGAATLFITLRDQDFKARLLFALISGFTFFAPLLHWSGVYVGSLPWLALTSLETALFSAIALIRINRDFHSVLRFAALFTLIELFRMKFPFGGFGWGRVGFTQTDSLSHLYPLIGVTGVSFFTILFASALVQRNTRLIVSFLLVLMITTIWQPQTTMTKTIQIDAIQGGVDQLGLDFNARALSVLNRHVLVTQSIKKPGNLVIWPENASDLDPIKNEEAARLLKEALSSVNRLILVGAVEQGSRGPANSSLLFSPEGKVLSRYVKQDLAPFGEYIPLRPVSEFFAGQAKTVTNFIPGEKWIPHSVEGMRFTSFICFEVLDDDHVRNGAQGSNFLVAQTNNATFGRSPQSSQQLQITRARSAELIREFAVVSTTGWSAHIDSRGRVDSRLPQFTPGYLSMNLQGMAGSSPASRLRSWHWAIFLAFALAFTRRRI